MLFKCIFVHFWLIKLISCDSSFTIVLDTTMSMQEELDIIKVNLGKTVNAFHNTNIRNYIIVPFNDPDVGEPVVVETPRDVIAAINNFRVSGGQKCPENSLAGIERALQISRPQSNIFVFTDAYSKDASKLSNIEKLCKSSRSQVVIFLSGHCNPTQSLPTVSDQVYYDVTKACSGAVVRFDSSSLRQAFRYINEVMNVAWTDVITYDTFLEDKQLSFAVDSFTKTVLLVVSGEYPVLEIATPNGSNRTFEKILESRRTQVVRLTEPSPGEHKVKISCRGKTSMTLYKKYELPLRVGFSTKLPRSMAETSRMPMPGRVNYILIDVSHSNIKIETVAIQIINEQERKSLTLEAHRSTGLYLTSSFIAPDKTFRIWINGYDESSYQEVKGSTEVLIPQQTVSNARWTKPKAEILETESITVDFGTNTTIACKVTGYPAPSIVWEDDNGVTLPSEDLLLEIPSLYISYVSIENVTRNFTIYGKFTNSEGEDSQHLNVYVYRPLTFDVLQTPADQTIEYGSEGRLYCKVSAYPEAETKWYYKDSEVILSDNVEVVPTLSALWIKNMTLDNVGEYKCEMTNDSNNKTYTAFVNISGIEAPKLEVEKTNIILKLGDWSSLECSIIKGKPMPSITWMYKPEDGYDFDALPDGVVTDNDKLKIASAQSNHKGVYRCIAQNIQGQDSADITVQLKYPPLILNSEPHTVTVKEEDDVSLPCSVDASPAPRVHWEMSQDDVLVALDYRHHTDLRNTHRFKALLNDSGNYHCIAENDIGRAEKTITVNVLVAPYIEAPKLKTVFARPGDNIVLMCNVTYGNPVPSTKWEFIALDSTTKILSRNKSSSPLYLSNVSYANEGSYLCIADNNVGTDSINIQLKLH